MSPKRVQNATRGLSAAAQAIADPMARKPLRYPSFPNVEKTAVLSVKTTGNLEVNGAGTGKALVFRSPVWGLWTTGVSFATAGRIFGEQTAYDDYVGSGTYTEIVMADRINHCSAEGGGAPLLDNQRWPIATLPNSDKFWTYTMFSPGLEEQQRDLKRKFLIEFDRAAAGSVNIRYASTNGRSVRNASVRLTQGTAASVWSIMIPDAAYAFVRVELLNDLNSSVVAIVKGVRIETEFIGEYPLTGHLLPFAGPPEWGVTTVPYRSSRATALSALFTNVTANLYKEGTVNCAILPMSYFDANALDLFNLPNDVWMQAVTEDRRYYGPLEKGLYTFTVPDAANAKFGDWVDSTLHRTAGGSVVAYPCFDFSGFEYVNVISFIDQDTAFKTQLAVTMVQHLEYRTTSVLFPTAVSMMTLEHFHGASLALTRLPVFYENFIHVGTIARLAMNAAKFVAPIVTPYVRPIMAQVGNKLIKTVVKQMQPKKTKPKKGKGKGRK